MTRVPPIRKDRKPDPIPGDERHTLRVRVGRYSWWDRLVERKHAPRWIVIAVDADFRMLLACEVRGCIVTTIR
jgi:hypothetical protein